MEEKLFGTYVYAPLMGFGILPTLEVQLEVIYLLGHERFYRYYLWKGYELSVSGGQWTQGNNEIRLSGITETISCDCMPFGRFSNFEKHLLIKRHDRLLALEESGSLSDGTPWKRIFNFASQTCIVPDSDLYPTHFFPSRHEELAACAEGILRRFKAEGSRQVWQ